MTKSFIGRILIIGFGAVGQALVDPLIKHLSLSADKVKAIAADADGSSAAKHLGISHEILPLTADNFAAVLESHLQAGDLLINVSVEVSSLSLIRWCQQHEVLYLDTCVEPWAGGYNSSNLSENTNYALRHEALQAHQKGTATAIIAHGANPGLVSHFVKKGLENLAADAGISSWNSYADLANNLGIKVIQIAERDTQEIDELAKPEVFYNTWSVTGLIAEAKQCAELGWGSHEENLSAIANHHTYGDKSGIYLNQKSVKTQVKSWVPSIGEQESYLITHHEALSIAHMLTIYDEKDGLIYRPTVYFAYNPCDSACTSIKRWLENGFATPTDSKVIRDEITEGFDELGVLFIFDKGSYWYGSTLEIREARSLAPYNNATTLQVIAGMLGAIQWMLDNPTVSVVEAESLDHERILQVAMPFLGSVRGIYTSWHPKGAKGAKGAKGLQFDDFLIKNK